MEPRLVSALAQYQSSYLDELIEKYKHSSIFSCTTCETRNSKITTFSIRSIYSIKFDILHLDQPRIQLTNCCNRTMVKLSSGPLADDHCCTFENHGDYFSIYTFSYRKCYSNNMSNVKFSAIDLLFIFQHLDLDIDLFVQYFSLQKTPVMEKCVTESLHCSALLSGTVSLITKDVDVARRLQKLKSLVDVNLNIKTRRKNGQEFIYLLAGTQAILAQLPKNLFDNIENSSIQVFGENIVVAFPQTFFSIKRCFNGDIFKISHERKTFRLHVHDLLWLLQNICPKNETLIQIENLVTSIYNSK